MDRRHPARTHRRDRTGNSTSVRVFNDGLLTSSPGRSAPSLRDGDQLQVTAQSRQVRAERGLGPQQNPHSGTFLYLRWISGSAGCPSDCRLQPFAACWVRMHFSNILTQEKSAAKDVLQYLSELFFFFFFCSAFWARVLVG